MSKKDIPLPNGSTYIDHKKRVGLGLSLSEYVVADYIEQCQNSGKQMSFENFKITVGVNEQQSYINMFTQLRSKGLIDEQDKLTDKWTGGKSVDAKFEEIWEVMNKKGLKSKSKEYFKRALKLTSFELILKACRLHVKNNPDVTYQMAVQNFLSPVYKPWLEEKDNTVLPTKENKNVLTEKFL